MQIKNKKISELEEAQDMSGFFTIGYRIVNGVKTSLKFGLEKVQTAYDGMLAIKDDVLNAIRDIRSLEEVVGTAEQERKVEYGEIIQSLHSAGETSSAQTALAKTATDAANTAASTANNAANGIDAKMKAAIDALIAGAPDALDTLNELSAALGNDPNFATTVLNELGKKIGKTDLVSDPTIGGVDKPASAESVKVLNDKVYLSHTFNSTSSDDKYVILLYEIKNLIEEYITIEGWFCGCEVESSMYEQNCINIDLNISNIPYIDSYITTVKGIGYYDTANKPSICKCTYQGKDWLALDVFNCSSESLKVFHGNSNVKLSIKSIPYSSFNGDVFTTINQEINNSIRVLYDDFKRLELLGDIAKVYNTTLDVFGIQDGSVVTKEQSTEVSNIMDKWNQGYIVTYVDTRQSTFHYGVLNVCRCDDGVPTTLSVINDRGDLLAYSFEPVGEATWTVTNKTSGGNTLFLTTPYLLCEDGEPNASDSAILNSLKGQHPKDICIAYCGRDGNGDALVPLTVSYDYSSVPMIVNLFFQDTYSGEMYKKVIQEDANIIGQYSSEMPTRVEFYKESITLNGVANTSDKNYKLDLASIKPLITGWYVFEGSISYVTSAYTFLCTFSIPMKFNDNRPDRDFYNGVAICRDNSAFYPVVMSFSSGNIFVKILSTLSFSYIAMNAPYCRLVKM